MSGQIKHFRQALQEIAQFLRRLQTTGRRSVFAKHPCSKLSCFCKGLGIKVNVRSNLLNSVRRRRTHSALAYLLLLAIGYGAIVEAAHSHGVSSATRSQLAAVSGADDSQSSYQDHSGHSECSLCQFQQQLFGGLASVILVAHTAQQFAFHSLQAISYLSTSALPTRGRGPPSL